MENIPLQYSIKTNTTNPAHTGGVFQIFIPPTVFLFFFDSLGLDGFKFFAVYNDENTIEKLLYNFKSCKVKEEKLTLCSLKFSIAN